MQSIVEETGSESDSSSESETERAGSAPRFKRDYLAEAEYTRPELDRQPVVVQFAQTVRQSHGHLLEYLSILDAIALRTVCHGLRRIVMDHAWDDASDAPETRLCKYPRRWRMAFPRALSVSTRRATSEWLPFFAGCKRVLLSSVAATAVGAASNLTAATDGDLAALHGASVLVLAGCNLPPGLSSLGFAHFRGVRVLDISGNKRVRLTDGALACLGGVRELSIGGVLCSSVTPAGWAALAGVASLLAPNCWGLRVTDAALEHVAGVRVIDLTSTDRSEVTDGGLAHIAGARVVRLGATPTGTYGGVDRAPVLVTDAGFAAFARVEELDITGWRHAGVTSDAFRHLGTAPLRRLTLRHCSQEGVGDAAFAHLAAAPLVELNMSHCTQSSITDAAFAHLPRLEALTLSSCTQPTLTDALLRPLAALRRLDASYCTQLRLAPETLAALAARRLDALRLDFCTQESLDEGALWGLRGAVRFVSARGCRQLSREAQRGWVAAPPERPEAAAAAAAREPLPAPAADADGKEGDPP